MSASESARGEGIRATPGTGVLTALAMRISRNAGLYAFAAFTTLALGIVNLVVVTRYLSPEEFGRLALLFFLAALLTVLYNLGTLQGSFITAYGASGEDDVEDEAVADRARDPRKTLTTGLLFTTAVAAVGTGLVWLAAGRLSNLMLGSGEAAGVVLLAGAAGGVGALWRFVLNILRMERRPVAYLLLSATRPLLVLLFVIILLSRGPTLGKVVAATAVGTVLAILLALVVTRSSFALAFDARAFRRIAVAGAPSIFVVASFWIAANVDIFVLSRFAPDAEVGVYRLATRFGAFVSYFTSALFTAWAPLTRTATFAAAAKAWGKPRVSGLIVVYFALGSVALLLVLTAGATTLVRLAPSSYASAAGLVPLAAGTFIATGSMTVIYRVSGRFPLKRFVYGCAALLATGIFVALSYLLVPRFGAYGMAGAVIAGFALSTVALVALMQRGRRPVELQYGRIAGAIALGMLSLIAILYVDRLSTSWRPALTVLALLTYPLLVTATGIVPRSHLRPLLKIVRSLGRKRSVLVDIRSRLAALPAQEATALRHAVSSRSAAQALASAAEYDDESAARMVRVLRGLIGERGSTDHDGRIGVYLFAPMPTAERDALFREMVRDDVDVEDVHLLEAAVEEVRRIRTRRWPRSSSRTLAASRGGPSADDPELSP